MNIIYDNFNSTGGKKLIQETLNEFSQIISVFESVYKIKPFNQQTAQSLTELYLLVKALNPATIFELGCGTRSSTIALTKALTNGCLHGVDFSPVNFDSFMNKNFPGTKYAPVIDHAMNALDLEISDDWKRPIFTLYDAHDTPNVNLFSHAKEKWFPKLKGSIIAMHDCSVTQTKVEYPPGDHYSCKHFSGLYISGFLEVVSLTDWLNKNNFEFYRPGDDLQKMGFKGQDSSIICFEAI